MFAPESFHEEKPLLQSPCALADLPRDLKRVLSVQFREFIHEIEDAQSDCSRHCDLHSISYLENCLNTFI